MEHRDIRASMMDVSIMSKREEFVEGMGLQQGNANIKDVPIKPGKEESVSDMEQMACK